MGITYGVNSVEFVDFTRKHGLIDKKSASKGNKR